MVKDQNKLSLRLKLENLIYAAKILFMYSMINSMGKFSIMSAQLEITGFPRSSCLEFMMKISSKRQLKYHTKMKRN